MGFSCFPFMNSQESLVLAAFDLETTHFAPISLDEQADFKLRRSENAMTLSRILVFKAAVQNSKLPRTEPSAWVPQPHDGAL